MKHEKEDKKGMKKQVTKPIIWKDSEINLGIVYKPVYWLEGTGQQFIWKWKENNRSSYWNLGKIETWNLKHPTVLDRFLFLFHEFSFLKGGPKLVPQGDFTNKQK